MQPDSVSIVLTAESIEFSKGPWVVWFEGTLLRLVWREAKGRQSFFGFPALTHAHIVM